MKLVSWNVNGIRACMGKGFIDIVKKLDADMFCIQETKMQEGQAEIPTEGYYQYWCSAEKKGYSGTALFSKLKPLSVTYGIGIDLHDHEGRVITAEYEGFYLINVYVPNSQSELKRLDYRMEWEDDFRSYVQALDEKKPVIICGDLNVAFSEIDLKNPKSNMKNAGFTPQERDKLGQLKDAGFIDSFRYFYPEKEGIYSWWSYRFNARKNNAGWRIDYFLVSEKLENYMDGAEILTQIYGSDHCPVVLNLKEL